ncbi:PREDICTED: tumor protein p63-regulated gene 1-like protein isoform X2 [Ceratosolen solmsi marchali]|uniref:Tumor protein p63-regulated gene 1-like protein isoform X2 n=1 Tax=Ceratosolen solmsi marchali TaxID=326594 RepID=A0AAJ7DV39_9HYME|nr:PREDICTED: tumor protein p63-regulated gene 1-like protein isoform X2 [Ceratosolen solmsi marchali]
MDDTFLQDEGPNFDRVTLEIKHESNEFLNSQNLKDKKNSIDSTSKGASAIKVVSIPYTRIDCHTFFSSRNEVVERALADCQRDLLSCSEEDELIGTWLLTEISLWDTEKERLILLTKTVLYSVKYDLISLKILEYDRVCLSEVDTLIAGELIYPATSLLPAVHQEWSSFTSLSGTTEFEPRSRNMFGMRLMWNKGQPLSMDKKWNPFAKNIPWCTFTSHPLYFHTGPDSNKTKYDVRALHSALSDLLSEHCHKLENPIIIENYIGIGSLMHNRIGLGFFKIRGKISF